MEGRQALPPSVRRVTDRGRERQTLSSGRRRLRRAAAPRSRRWVRPSLMMGGHLWDGVGDVGLSEAALAVVPVRVPTFTEDR